tara:strand:+ start:3323 stop:6811 length:3489 start_codon:yes stop_codon:yes gene_type:complete
MNDVVMNSIKNKFRGIISTFRSKGFVKNKKVSDSAILRQNIKTLYLDCRVKAHETDFQEVVTWLNKNIHTQLPEYYSTPIGYEELRFINTDVLPAPLLTEIKWVVTRLAFERDNLNKFLSYKQETERLLLNGNYKQALDVLINIEKELGVSLWSIQLKVSLLQTIDGLEAQKQYTAEVRNVWPGGILSYVTYFTSVRNEDRTSLVKFNDDMNVKLNGHNIDESLRAYLKYRITTVLPEDESEMAQMLQIEQLGTVYDLYESLIAVFLKSLSPNSATNFKGAVINSLEKLETINDPRLVKIKFHLTGEYEPARLQQRNTNLSDKLISDHRSSLLDIYRLFKKCDKDVWGYIYLGIWLSLTGTNVSKKKPQPHNMHRLIGHALSTQNMLFDINALIKLSINYSGLDIFSGINEFLHFILKRGSEHYNLWSLHLIGIHSAHFGIEDLNLNSNSKQISRFKETVTSTYWRANSNNQSCLPNTYSISIIKSLTRLSENNIEGCLQSLNDCDASNIPQPFRLLHCQMKLFALSREGSRSNIVNLVNETVPYSKDILEIVSFDDQLIDFEFEDFDSTDNILSTPIALFVAWTKTDSSKFLSYLRIATKKAIKKAGCEKPSELQNTNLKEDNYKLIFFLRNICLPHIIDNISSLKGTKTVLNERQDICRLLSELDPNNQLHYQAEIENIADDLMMEDGKRVVDRTRIYVDMDAHTRWFMKELPEDYARYKDLLGIRVTGSQNYKEIVDDYFSADSATKTTFTPENEADAILLGIVAKASHDFLTNSKYGLDYYLSKRIRHQSFIGLIRSHLEFSELITTRESEDKDFEYNTFWVNRFKSLSQCKKDELNSLLSLFAKEFDNKLIDVRDNVFQLNTEACPTGLIKIDFNIQIMSLLKHFIIETDATFEKFVYYSNTFMWALLQPSLEQAKKYINDNLKPNIMHNADKLKANARKLAGGDSAFDDFELKLTEQIAAVQRSLEDVMAWFTPLIGISADRVVLSVDKVLSLSINASLDMLKPFNPNIKTNINNKDDIHLHQQELTFVNDTIFILLDNIKTHSGIKRPDIILDIDVDADSRTFTISCSNQTKQSERKQLLVEINKIKKLISDEKLGDRSKSEGRSGFIKLAASIYKADKGYLSFDLGENGEFNLSITNDLHIVQEPLEIADIENV